MTLLQARPWQRQSSPERSSLKKKIQITSRPHLYRQDLLCLWFKKHKNKYIKGYIYCIFFPGSAWEQGQNCNVSGWETWLLVCWWPVCPGLILGKQPCTAGIHMPPGELMQSTQPPSPALGWHVCHSNTRAAPASVSFAIIALPHPTPGASSNQAKISTLLCSCRGDDGVPRYYFIENRIDLF